MHRQYQQLITQLTMPNFILIWQAKIFILIFLLSTLHLKTCWD